MGRPVVHFEIGGPDGKALMNFYASQFGWKIDDGNPMGYGVVDTGVKESIGGGISGSPPDGPPAWCTFYIAVTDVDAALASIEKAGGKTIMPKTVIPDMVTFAQFADPAGNVVGLVLDDQPAPRPSKKKARREKKAARAEKAKEKKAKKVDKRAKKSEEKKAAKADKTKKKKAKKVDKRAKRAEAKAERVAKKTTRKTGKKKAGKKKAGKRK